MQAIAYNARREISALSIVNGRGQIVYSLKEKPALAGITEMQMAAIQMLLPMTKVKTHLSSKI